MSDQENEYIDRTIREFPEDKRTCTMMGGGINRIGCIFFTVSPGQAATMGVADLLNAICRSRGVIFESRGVCQVTGTQVTVGAACGINDNLFRQGLRNMYDRGDINAGMG